MLSPLIELHHHVLLSIVNYVKRDYHHSKFIYFHRYVVAVRIVCLGEMFKKSTKMEY